jgi:peptidoglycan-N-acetylglucosamine deacetylase
MRLRAGILIGVICALAASGARAADCPGNPDAIGTSRVLMIDPRELPLIGTMQYTRTLPLEDKEVVLTFDDGPLPPYTNRVLDVLAEHCVRANYFIIGRMARGYPDLVKRIQAAGHTLGSHSENHLLAFDRMPLNAVQSEIEQGFASLGAALGDRRAVAPFFRIPGLLRAQQVEGYLHSRGIATWSADISGDDWTHISAREVVRRVMNRLEEKGKGVVLLHDIQPATALAIPELLRELKGRGYRIVQVVPGTAADRAKVAARQPAPPPAPAAPAAAAAPPPAVKVEPAAAKTEPPAAVRPEPPVARAPVAPRPEAPAADGLAHETANAKPAAQPPAAAPQAPAPAPKQEIVAPSVPAAPVAPPPVSPQEMAAASADEMPAAAPPSQPVTMPEPSSEARATPEAAAAAEASAKAEPAPDQEHRRPVPRELARPLAPALKPTQSMPSPAKLSRHFATPWPGVVSVPVPRAGGVGVSSVVRTTQNDGRFQPER